MLIKLYFTYSKQNDKHQKNFKIDPNPNELLYQCVQKGLQKGKLAAST